MPAAKPDQVIRKQLKRKIEQEKLTQQPLIDNVLKAAAEYAVPMKWARFGTYDLQAREEYAKFRSKFDKNKQDAINRSQDTQWKTNLRNLTSSVKRLANSDKPTQLTQGLKNGGRIIFDKKNKIMKLEQNTGFEYTKDEAVALGNPDLAGTNKKEMLTINPSQMMDVVFEKWGHEGFEKTFPELFKIYGAGEPIKY